MGYRKLSARPRHHAQAEGAIEAFKKTSRPPGRDRTREGRRSGRRRDLVRRRGAHRPEEQDHATLGAGAARGRPRRTTSAPPRPTSSARSVPKEGKGAASSCPGATPRRWTCIWPRSRRRSRRARMPCCSSIRPDGTCRASLSCPPTSRIVPLPAKCPELNPQENVWQFMRDNWFSNRVFTCYENLGRPLLRRLEQTHRSALENHVHRAARLGAQVLIQRVFGIIPSL